MKYRLIGVGASLVIAVMLTGCQAKATTLVKSDAGQVTQAEVFKQIENQATTQQAVQELTLNKVLNQRYHVSQAEVTAKLKAFKRQAGANYHMILERNHVTEPRLKSQIKANLLMEKAISAKYPVTKAQLKKARAAYMPMTTVQHIATANEKQAPKIIAELNAGASFDSQVRKYQNNRQAHTTAGKLAQFDSYNQTLAPAIVQATAKLRVGHYVTKPVKTVMATADTKDKPTYEIINVVSRRSKTAAVTDDSGKQIDVTNYLREKIQQQRMMDKQTQVATIRSVFKAAHVKVVDAHFAPAFNDYLTTQNS